MGAPKSVVRFKTRQGKTFVEYTSNVDFCQYSILQLTRAAMKDVGKFIVRICNAEAMKYHGGGLRKTKRVRGTSSAFLYNVPFADLGELPHAEMGIVSNTWYGADQELGQHGQPQRRTLYNTVMNNVSKIVEIESKYLTGLESEAEALRLIDEAAAEMEGVDE